MQNSKLLLIILLLTILTKNIQAQKHLGLISKVKENYIELRWVPTNLDAWNLGKECGYIIERSTILRNNKLVEPIERKLITSQPIKIADITEWQKFENDKYAMIAGECVFGERDSIETNNFPIMIYRKHKDEERRLGFALFSADLSKNTAKLLGLYFKDTDVKKDEKYLYKLTFAQNDSLIHDTATTFVALSDYQPINKPSKPYAYFDNNYITIWWSTLNQENFSAYYIEKSINNDNQFEKLTESPISVATNKNRLFYSDTLVNTQTSYYYRIVGIDAFGDESVASDYVNIKGNTNIKTTPEFSNVETINNNSVKLSWQYDSDCEILGFKIYRSKSLKDNKTLIYSGNSKSQQSFIDTKPMNDNYYFLSVYNSVEEKINPFPQYAMLIDSIPPTIPQKPFGVCDSNGIITLTWTKHIDNDVIGYRLYRSNSEDKNFMMCEYSMIADTIYHDTINLNTLSKFVYYKLKAVDSRDNQSELSDVAIVKRYDTICPLNPKFKSIEYQKHKVKIEFLPSTSNDVVKYLIFRKLAKDDNFDTIAVLASDKNLFLDETVYENSIYHYGIQAVDDFGNKSEINKKSFKVPLTKSENINLKHSFKDGILSLSWTTNNSKPIKYIIIYRKIDNNSLKTYTIISVNDKFIEKDFETGKTYSYCIRLVYQDDTESPLSNQVNYKN